MVKTCRSCQEFSNAQSKCSMVEVEIPRYAWHTLGIDLFEVNGKWFLLVTDCFSKVPFVRTVPNTGALATIKALKNIMGENGVPVKVISDNGVHFVAHEFKKFSKQYGFEMIFSSPRYARGHALIERHVQTIEKCMIKCKASGQDFDLALLALRATPLDSSLKSPGEILNGRKYRSTLPDISHIRSKQSADNKSTRQKLQQKQSASATYYNRSTKSKNALSPGQNVRLFNFKHKTWEPATIVSVANTPRSYIVQRCSGGVPLRRNRIHLKETKEKWNTEMPTNKSAPQQNASFSTTGTHNDVGVTRERGKRMRRQTELFQST